MTTLARHSRGWTLVELLLALALIGLISGWALPIAQGMLQRTQRSQARLSLLSTAHCLERYASAQGRYPNTLPATAWETSGLNYQIVYTGENQTFLLLAVPQRSQAGDPCGTLSLDHQGVRGVRLAQWSAEMCWSR